jgi:hypothetical protein
VPRLPRVALLLSLVSIALSGCSSGSGSATPIQGGGNGSGDAAPGDAQGSGSGGGGGLAGGTPSGGGGTSAGGGSLGAYDPVKGPLHCMRIKHVHAYRDGGTIIQVAPKPTGPRVVFTSTQGDAQAAQIHGQAEGAEVIGAALLYVNTSSDGLIKVLEKCLDAGGSP